MAGRERALEPRATQGVYDDRIPVRGNALVHEVEATDETVVFAKDRGELLLLNAIGAGVFHLVDGRRSVADIATILGEHFPEADSPLDDVVKFLTELERVGALRFA